MTLYKENDEWINDKDIMIAVASNIISITILFLPRYISENTISADGWISIFFGGIIAMAFAWLLAKIASSFPSQSFLSFATYLVSKPVAIMLSIIFIAQYIAISSLSYSARSYLFSLYSRSHLCC